MANQLFKKIKFLLTSSNQHGVHSPFVFEYLTKCVYRKNIYPKSKTIDILLKSIPYFGYKNLNITENENVKKIVSQRLPDVQYDQRPFDLIFVKEAIPDLLSGILSEGEIHNDSMVLINSIHKNKKTEELWHQIITDEKATVTIDFFYCGVVFFRQEQVKEHFKIRI